MDKKNFRTNSNGFAGKTIFREIGKIQKVLLAKLGIRKNAKQAKSFAGKTISRKNSYLGKSFAGKTLSHIAPKFLCALACCTALASPSLAQAPSAGVSEDMLCRNSQILGTKLITDICWKCVFPIRVAGSTISPPTENKVPDGAANKPVCICKDELGVPHVGLQTSFWEPYRLIEFQRTPGCLSVLNGTKMSINPLHRGRHGYTPDNSTLITHYHYYSFPVLYMLSMFAGKGCNPGGYSDLDLMFLSELDPTWYDMELSIFTNPEALLFANPASAVSCMADSIASLADNPITAMFWCAGTWGLVYPLSGHINAERGVIKSTSLASVRVLTQLHRRGFAWKTIGNESMCNGVVVPYFPKNQYRFSLIWPVPETQKNHHVGELVELWGSGKLIPVAGEDPIYIIWRWIDCCNRY